MADISGRILAVDLFFLLSGFVIAHSYGERLRGEMSLREFMLQRLVRLYPLYLLGIALGVIAVLPDMGSSPSLTWRNLVIDIASGVLFIPTPTRFSINHHYGIFPLNYASWSLFFELIANVFFALVTPRLNKRCLGIIIAAGALAMAVAAIHANTLNLGAELGKAHLLGGLGRAMFAFFGGVAIYRLWQSGWFASLRLPSWIVFVSLAVAMALPRSGSWHGVSALLCAWTILPVLVFAGAQAKAGPRMLLVCANLGAASYAFYILQAPTIDLFQHFCSDIAGMPMATLGWMGVLMVTVVVYIAALAADALFDIPARRWLKTRVQRLVRSRNAAGRNAV